MRFEKPQLRPATKHHVGDPPMTSIALVDVVNSADVTVLAMCSALSEYDGLHTTEYVASHGTRVTNHRIKLEDPADHQPPKPRAAQT